MVPYASLAIRGFCNHSLLTTKKLFVAVHDDPDTAQYQYQYQYHQPAAKQALEPWEQA
jgi:hypothetical protein